MTSMGRGEASTTHFDWSGPHDHAVRRARIVFFLVATVLAAYAATVLVAIVVGTRLADAGPGHGALGAWGVAAIAIALYAGVAVAVSIVARGGFSRSIRAMAGARPPGDDEAEAARRTIDTFALSRGITTPRLWLVDDLAPNGFAFGTPRRANVCLTSGALRLGNTELEALCASLITALTMLACVYAMSAADLLFWCGIATNIIWFTAVLVLLSSIIGVPGIAVAIVVVGIVILVAITQPLLFVARRIVPKMLDEVAELCDLETVRCTAQPRSLGSLLIHLAEDDRRISTPVAIEHRWFERDAIEVLPRRSFFPVRLLTSLFDQGGVLEGATAEQPMREALLSRAHVAIELADGDAELTTRLNRAQHRS